MKKEEMKTKIEEVLEKIRPALQRDGGDVELVDIKDKIVKVRLTGACSGCSMSQLTLKNFVESIIKERFPEVEGVESV